MTASSRTDLQHAAALIRQGGLVAFPTETVYGLGANALDPAAVEKIFAAKRRPRHSPLIVHVSSVEQGRALVSEWPGEAQKLSERFWPGPLTLVLPKAPCVPDVVTAGLPTVGIRMPSHPLALELIRLAGVPVAAPSANPFTRLSPTRAAHVYTAELVGVDLVLDGGAAELGIESTVLSLTAHQPRILRLGMISKPEIEEVIGPVADLDSTARPPGSAHTSPGQHARHYSPRTRLLLWHPGAALPPGYGVILTITRIPPHMPGTYAVRSLPSTPKECAARLYDLLHQFDAENWDWIAVELPPDTPAWQAVRDRILRAAH